MKAHALRFFSQVPVLSSQFLAPSSMIKCCPASHRLYLSWSEIFVEQKALSSGCPSHELIQEKYHRRVCECYLRFKPTRVTSHALINITRTRKKELFGSGMLNQWRRKLPFSGNAGGFPESSYYKFLKRYAPRILAIQSWHVFLKAVVMKYTDGTTLDKAKEPGRVPETLRETTQSCFANQTHHLTGRSNYPLLPLVTCSTLIQLGRIFQETPPDATFVTGVDVPASKARGDVTLSLITGTLAHDFTPVDKEYVPSSLFY